MNGMEGYLFNYMPMAGSCLHCVYPEDDPAWDEMGFPVLGAVSGMLGCMMALEAIKLLTGFGKPLLAQMLVFNTGDMEFRKVKIPRDEHCEVCGARQKGEHHDDVVMRSRARAELSMKGDEIV